MDWGDIAATALTGGAGAPFMTDWVQERWDAASGQGARRRGREAYARSQEILKKLKEANLVDPDFDLPSLEELGPDGLLELQGVLTAATENANTIDGSEFDNLSEDPETRERQMQSLDTLQEYATSGTTSADEAAIEALLSKSRQDARGASDAINAQSRRRGTSGSGMDIVAKLGSRHAANQLASSGVLQQAGQRQTNRMNASGQAAAVAGQVRGQDYQVESDRARARDLMNQFNSQLSQGVDSRNIDRRMSADRTNLENRQRIADYNSQRADRNALLRNQNRLTNYGLQSDRNRYLNSLRSQRANDRNNNIRSRAGVEQQMGQRHDLDAANSRAALAAALGAGGQAVASYFSGGAAT